MLRCRFSFLALLLVPLCAPAQPKAPYYPDAAWQRRTPAEAFVKRLLAALPSGR